MQILYVCKSLDILADFWGTVPESTPGPKIVFETACGNVLEPWNVNRKLF